MTRDRTRTMLLRNSRSIQKHLIGTGYELSCCDMRAAGCALCVIALRSHLTNLFRRVTVWRHVVWRSDVTSWDILTSRFTSRPPAIKHIHVKTLCTYFHFSSIKCIIYFQYNSVKIVNFSFYFPFSFIELGSCLSQPLVRFCPFIVCFLLFYKTYL